VEKDYQGPQLPLDADGRHCITQEFVDAMLEWYKSGKSLPRRYVWEIVLAVFDLSAQDHSLVDVPIAPGHTCDVIGDVHGQSLMTFSVHTTDYRRAILRCIASPRADGQAVRDTQSAL
jgi:hypothetical protein